MGYRLHYAKKYEVEWDGGWFNWLGEEWRDMLGEEMPDSYANLPEYGTDVDCEIYRAELKEYIQRLTKSPLDQQNKYFADMTNNEVLFALSELDRDAPAGPTIMVAWF